MMEGLFQNIERTEIGTASKALSVYLLSLHPPVMARLSSPAESW